jgi:DNA-binding SARP family transcriptional activator
VIEFRILGPFTVLDDGKPVSIQGAKERAVLAILLLNTGQVVSADHLIDALWETETPATARNSLHVRIAALRKTLGSARIETKPTGYAVQAQSGELDLQRFEQLILRGRGEDLREALALWSGPPLADFERERWAASAIARLEEMRLLALERLADIDLELGRHAELVGQLEAELVEHPFRERLRAQLMLALYRSGRQADALAAYRAGRAAMVEQLGIEPYPAMQELEQAILRQDPALDLGQPGEVERSILVAAFDGTRLDGLVEIAATLARRSRRTLILTRPIDPDGDLADATDSLHAESERLAAAGHATRVAAFRTGSPGRDVAGFAAEQDVDLVLVDGSAALLEDPAIADLLDASPCDVAVASAGEPGSGTVLVPFIGADHDWSAVELGAWLASARDGKLTLVGPTDDERDSSRLLASASIAVQRALGVTVVPVVIPPGADDLVEVANEASVVVVGLSDRWRTEGLGPVRSALATRATPPVILVHRGLRPGGLAPPDGLSRFTWSIRGPG